MWLTIYRGTKEIGGNCVELRTDSTRLIIDVGMPLVGPDREPFDSRSMRKKSVTALLAEGVLPRVPGLFDGTSRPDAILLSHAHADHSGLISYTKPEIPVYMTKGTSKMLHAGSIFAGQQEIKRERTKTVTPGRPFKVGDFTITAYSVDHSAFDSVAFIIEADGKRVLYSGDLRLHGRKPGMAKQLIAATKEKPIDLMLMEGTHFGREHEIKEATTEQELEEKIVGHIRSAPGIILATFSPMHVDRLVTFYRAAKRTGRTFVVDVYAAYVMHLVSGQCKIPKPETEAGIKVYYNQYFVENWQQRRLKNVHDLFTHNQITLDEIRAKPDQYVSIFRPSVLEKDFGGQLPEGSRCLYSYWLGYLDRPDWTQLMEKLKGVRGDFIKAHVSGHIFTHDIISLVRSIGPKVVVPIHTFVPEAFASHFANTRALSDGQEVAV